MKSFISRSVIIASSLLVGLIVFSATPSIADSPLSKSPAQKETKQNPAEALGKFEPAAPTTTGRAAEEPALVAASPYVATAYSLRGRTASGRMVSRGYTSWLTPEVQFAAAGSTSGHQVRARPCALAGVQSN